MSPWDECICGHEQYEHNTDPDTLDEGGCAVPDCPCPWFNHDPVCRTCGYGYECECA
ncbi:MAG TPA: hypothetical protein VGL39_28175 [Jatrophihabitantaceae bacterium]|jgi:hypothetical protein